MHDEERDNNPLIDLIIKNKKEYIENVLNTEYYIYDYIQKAEYLRTKGFTNPQDLTMLKIDAFCEIHQDIDNKRSIQRMDEDTAVIALFKTKNALKEYKNLLMKLMDNKI